MTRAQPGGADVPPGGLLQLDDGAGESPDFSAFAFVPFLLGRCPSPFVFLRLCGDRWVVTLASAEGGRRRGELGSGLESPKSGSRRSRSTPNLELESI